MFGPEERDFFEKPTGAADNYSLARSYGTQPRGQSVGASVNFNLPLIPFNIGGGNTTPISNSTTLQQQDKIPEEQQQLQRAQLEQQVILHPHNW